MRKPNQYPTGLNLLEEHKDVFPIEVLGELTPIKGIGHQIDLILSTPLLNKPAYRTNPNETRELHEQLNELMNKGYTWLPIY